MNNEDTPQERVEDRDRWFQLVLNVKEWAKDEEIEMADTHYGHFASRISELLAQARQEEREKTANDVVGEIGAQLLAKHSSQDILDAYFEVANEELEKHGINN